MRRPCPTGVGPDLAGAGGSGGGLASRAAVAAERPEQRDFALRNQHIRLDLLKRRGCLGTLRIRLMDAVSNMTGEELDQGANYELYC